MVWLGAHGGEGVIGDRPDRAPVHQHVQHGVAGVGGDRERLIRPVGDGHRPVRADGAARPRRGGDGEGRAHPRPPAAPPAGVRAGVAVVGAGARPAVLLKRPQGQIVGRIDLRGAEVSPAVPAVGGGKGLVIVVLARVVDLGITESSRRVAGHVHGVTRRGVLGRGELGVGQHEAAGGVHRDLGMGVPLSAVGGVGGGVLDPSAVHVGAARSGDLRPLGGGVRVARGGETHGLGVVDGTVPVGGAGADVGVLGLDPAGGGAAGAGAGVGGRLGKRVSARLGPASAGAGVGAPVGVSR